jgi:hypothetical protein
MDDATQKLVDDAREYASTGPVFARDYITRLADALEAAQRPPVPEDAHEADAPLDPVLIVTPGVSITPAEDHPRLTRHPRMDHDWPCPLFYTGHWREDRTPTRECTHEKGCPERDQARYPRTDTTEPGDE